MKKILPARITCDFLESLGACDNEIEVFARTFPNGATVTKANIKRASEAGLNIQWLSDTIGTSAANRGKCWCGKRHVFDNGLFAKAYAEQRAKQRATKKAASR